MSVALHILWKTSHHILFHDKQIVSDSIFLKSSLITSCPMTNSLWVTVHFFLIRLINVLQPTESGWHFSERQSHHILSCIQQVVSGITHHFLHLLIWATDSESHCRFQKAVSSHPVICMTNRVWVTPHIFLKDGLITSCPMTNSLWVSLHKFLWKAVSLHFIIFPTGSEWHCTFLEK